jgi:hypothetical protein
MDPGSIGALVPIAAIAAFAVIKVSRIKAQAGFVSGPDPQTARRLDAMENELETLRQEMGETQERLDFTERLLAQHRETRIDPPK